jgi:chaperone required for assembly of F1-ATPase
MKKPYKSADYKRHPSGAILVLDGRPARTPGGNEFLLPNEKLAQAVAREWQEQKDVIRKETMPLTQLACVALDLAAPKRDAVLKDILPYGETDLICYRAGDTQELVREQALLLDPIVNWAQEHFGVTLNVTDGVMPVKQPAENKAKFADALAAYDAWKLAALAVSVKLLGSLVLGFAFVEKRIDAGEAFRLSHLEELFETRAWGEDEEKEAKLKKVRGELEAMERFLGLL